MKLKNTLLLLVLGAIAFGFIYFVERKMPGSGEVDESRILNFDRGQIQEIEVTNSTGKVLIRQTASNIWRIEGAVNDRADSGVINALCTSLETLQSTDTLADEKTDKDKLKDYGLSKPEATVRFKSAEGTVELQFGKETPVESLVYARVEGASKIHIISKSVKDQVVKKPEEFRDRRLSELSTQQIERVVLKSSSGEIELLKENDHWSLIRPIKARADDQAVNDLIATATATQISAFMPEAQDLGSYGLSEPRGTISLHAEDVKEPFILQFGGEVKGDKKDEPDALPMDEIYVQLPARKVVVSVPKELDALLAKQPADLRDRHIVRVNSDMVDRITIEAPGKEKIVLGRTPESWVRKAAGKDLPINSVAVDALLKDMEDVNVVRFVADSASDLAPFGLAQPSAKITLSSYASENTAETSSGDKPLAVLLLGKFEGDAGYAKLDDEPFVVAVPRLIFDNVWTDPIQWQELSIYDYKPEDIQSIEIAHSGEPTVTLIRDKEKGWKLSKGDSPLNQTRVQTLATTLAHLRALRWVSASKLPEQSLDKPSLVVSFTTSSDQKGKVSIGAASASEGFYTMADGVNGTFLISMPDYTAFQAPLMEKEKEKPVKPSPEGNGAEIAPTPLPAITSDSKPQEPTEVPVGKSLPAPETGKP